MHARVLNRMREKVRDLQYVMTLHAEEEMSDDNLSIFDVESVILTGEIIERQKDRKTGEWKYLVNGQALRGEQTIVVVKIGPTEKLIVITIYRK